MLRLLCEERFRSSVMAAQGLPDVLDALDVRCKDHLRETLERRGLLVELKTTTREDVLRELVQALADEAELLVPHERVQRVVLDRHGERARRAGTGWSDIGPFPRSVGRECEELRALLDGAGEKGPFSRTQASSSFRVWDSWKQMFDKDANLRALRVLRTVCRWTGIPFTTSVPSG